MNTKGKSILFFILIVFFVGLFDYAGINGLVIGDYQVKSFKDTINKGLDLQGGTSVVERIQGGTISQDKMDRTIEQLNLRVNKLGVSETTVQQEGKDKIRIDVPGEFDADKVKSTVAKTGKLTFVGPDSKVILSGTDVKKATATKDQNGSVIIDLELNTAGGKKFADATQKFLGQAIAIKLDEDVLTNPTVQTVITDGRAQITGNRDLAEADRIAKLINSGALPVTLKTESAQVVGASLGASAMPQSVKAGAIGIGIVLLFMLLYYRVPGLLADVALCLFTFLVLLIFSLANITLTLSGIAGFLLTVGMAVDANILIFERMKEELKAGKSIKSAIDAGFHRAMSSILDSNITTIIAGAVLFMMGSGSIKGFALTLIIGTLMSMFTAITVTRTLIKLAANMGWFKEKWTIGTFGVHDVRRGIM